MTDWLRENGVLLVAAATCASVYDYSDHQFWVWLSLSIAADVWRKTKNG